MSILVGCTHCGAKMQVRGDLAGEHRPCPKCGATISIPSYEPEDAIAEELAQRDREQKLGLSTAQTSREPASRNSQPPTQIADTVYVRAKPLEVVKAAIIAWLVIGLLSGLCGWIWFHWVYLPAVKDASKNMMF